jgi:hypothetical protein
MVEDLFKSAALPDGDYAIVEILGHRTLIGRIAEVERFGTKMLQIEPVFQGKLLPAVYHGGGSIYALTPCTREVAGAKGPMNAWQLPGAVASTLPAEMLPAPKEPDLDTYDFDEEDHGE